MTRLAVVVLVLTASLVPAPLAGAQTPDQGSSILAAMRDELKRSMGDLRLTGEPSPYYIAYEVEDLSSARIAAQLGAIVTDASSRSATLSVEVRVGDYAFDSSRFVTQGRGGVRSISGEGAVSAPIDGEYLGLRRQIWLLTDAAYKRAVTTLARKKAAFQNRVTQDALPDLSREEPARTVEPAWPASGNRGAWSDHARRVSAVFASNADLLTSEVSVLDMRGIRYYLNSEGFSAVTPIQSASLRMAAETQADDGAVLRDVYSLTEKTLDSLPPAEQLVERARDMSDRLAAQRTAPIGEDYTGPVLLEGQASAELVAQTFVPLMLARRAPDADSLRLTQVAQSQITPFLSRIGLRVLPDGFSVSDTPSLVSYAGRPVPGAYAADDEGVPAKDVMLVDKGRLMTLLMGRTPQKNLPQSNGHGRGGTVQAGVFQMQSAHAVPASELKQKYLDLLKLQGKSFGYIVRGIASPADIPGGGPLGGLTVFNAVKVLTDGTEQPVRGLRFADVAFASFKDIVESSDERLLYSYRAAQGAVVSVIAPNLMFEELEIQRITDVAQKPPLVPSPLKR